MKFIQTDSKGINATARNWNLLLLESIQNVCGKKNNWVYCEKNKNKNPKPKAQKQKREEKDVRKGRESCSALTQKLLAYSKVCPNTITTPTTRIAAELSSTIFCHVFK